MIFFNIFGLSPSSFDVVKHTFVSHSDYLDRTLRTLLAQFTSICINKYGLYIHQTLNWITHHVNLAVLFSSNEKCVFNPLTAKLLNLNFHPQRGNFLYGTGLLCSIISVLCIEVNQRVSNLHYWFQSFNMYILSLFLPFWTCLNQIDMCILSVFIHRRQNMYLLLHLQNKWHIEHVNNVVNIHGMYVRILYLSVFLKKKCRNNLFV